MAATPASDAASRVPRLGPACDPGKLVLTPQEGFLLSRIDGVTPWKVLREIGGLSPEEVDERLGQWLAQGLIEVGEARGAAPRTSAADGPPGAVALELDEGLEIDLEMQQRVIDFQARLGAAYHEILGVARDADVKAIKKAYFALSKEFHPDRYFRREIGPYAKALEGVFKRILEAYELLSDPTVRAEVEKSMSAAAGASPAPQVASPTQEAPRELTRIERLRARMPFRLPESVLHERRQRAREFFDAARRDIRLEHFVEAAAKMRLAIAFDPFDDEIRDRFGGVQARAAEARAEALTAEADEEARKGIADAHRFKDVLRLYEEALLYRPHQPDLNDKAARAAIGAGELERAREYVDRALEHSPEVARHHVTLARLHQASGNPGHAIKAVEKALELDREDREASELRAQLASAARSSRV